jgi:ribosomal protein S18 acetylase RimI-like enzyme
MFSAMNVRSLGYRTDLIFQRFGGEIVDRGSYLVLLTPSNPAYRWGNMLLFADPPEEDDLVRWRQLFAREVGTPPEVNHMVFAWDTVDGEAGYIQPFLDAGFEIERNVVLSTDAVHLPPKVKDDIDISPLETKGEWQAALELELLCRDEGEDQAGYRTFIERKMAQYREMIAAGMGRWFGAFLDGKLVADMGLFVEDGIGRFQSVKTHPAYRRRGICGTMVHAVARRGLEKMGAETLVMIADSEYHAAKIYESVGFEPTERIVGIERK